MPSVTLSSLRDQCKQRGDFVNSGFITDSEWASYINQGIAALYDILVSAYGEDYYATSYTFSTVASTDTYALPSTFYKSLGVDWRSTSGSGDWSTVERFNFTDRNKTKSTDLNYYADSPGLQYRLHGSNMVLSPVPTVSSQQVQLHYVPTPTYLSADEDTWNFYAGYEDFVISDAVIKAKAKQEDDVTSFIWMRTQAEQRIKASVPIRDVGEPQTITDVYARNSRW